MKGSSRPTRQQGGHQTNQDQGSSLCQDHRDKLTAQAILLDLVLDHVRCVHRPDDLPEGAPDYWAGKLPALLFRYGNPTRIVTEYKGQPVVPGQALDRELGSTGMMLGRLFNNWAKDDGGPPMTTRKVVQRVRDVPGVEDVRLGSEGSGTRGLNIRERGLTSAGSADSPPHFKTFQVGDRSEKKLGSGEVLKTPLNLPILPRLARPTPTPRHARTSGASRRRPGHEQEP